MKRRDRSGISAGCRTARSATWAVPCVSIVHVSQRLSAAVIPATAYSASSAARQRPLVAWAVGNREKKCNPTMA